MIFGVVKNSWEQCVELLIKGVRRKKAFISFNTAGDEEGGLELR